MKITIKCPNCYQQLSSDNRFCLYCGYDLSKTSESSEEEPVLGDVESTKTDPAPYDGPCFCPKGHDVPDPSLGFCPICGSPLTYEDSAYEETGYEESPEIPEMPRREKPVHIVSRKCKCGYICDDPELSFCPACGIPLDSASHTEPYGWECVCGEMNPMDSDFCSSCGKPRESDEHKGESGGKSSEPPIPYGMKPPTESDLDIKGPYESYDI